MEFKYRAVDAQPPLQFPSSSSSDQSIQAGFSGSYRTEVQVNEAIQLEKIKIREEIIVLQREMEKEQIHQQIITAETIRRRELVAEVIREMAMEREIAMGNWNYNNPISIPPAENLWFNHQLFPPNLLTARDTSYKPPPLMALDKTEPSADNPSLLNINKTPKKEWSCALCRISAPDERALKQHFQGKKHRAERVATSRAKNTSKKLGNSLMKSKEEWRCALCRISAPNGGALAEHFRGKKHKAEEAAMRNENTETKSETSNLTSNIESSCKPCVSTPNERPLTEPVQSKRHIAKEALRAENKGKEADHSELTKDKEWSCAVCQISAPNEWALYEHFRGKKHKANKTALRIKIMGNKADISTRQKEWSPGPCQIGTKEALRSQEMAKKSENSKGVKDKEEWSCALCRISAPNQGALNEHIRGEKHKANKTALRIKIMGNNVDISTRLKEWSPGPCQIGAKEALRTQNMAKKSENSKGGKDKEEWSCAICRISAPNQGALNEHIRGKKHKAKEEDLRIRKNIGKKPDISKPTITNEWRCDLCRISAPNEGALNEHFQGKKHRANETAMQTENVTEEVESTKLTHNEDEWTSAPCQVSASNEKAANKQVQGNKTDAKESSSKWAEKSSSKLGDSKQASDGDQETSSESVMENHMVGRIHNPLFPVKFDHFISSDRTIITAGKSVASSITFDQLKAGKEAKLKDAVPQEVKMEGQTVEEAERKDSPAKEARKEGVIAEVRIEKPTESDEETRVDEEKVKMAPGNTNTLGLGFWSKLYNAATLPKVVMDIMSNKQKIVRGQTEQSEA